MAGDSLLQLYAMGGYADVNGFSRWSGADPYNTGTATTMFAWLQGIMPANYKYRGIATSRYLTANKTSSSDNGNGPSIDDIVWLNQHGQALPVFNNGDWISPDRQTRDARRANGQNPWTGEGGRGGVLETGRKVLEKAMPVLNPGAAILGNLIKKDDDKSSGYSGVILLVIGVILLGVAAYALLQSGPGDSLASYIGRGGVAQ